MKKNYFLRAAAVLLVCGMFSLCTIPRTLSRFSGTFNIPGSTVRAGIFEVALQKADGTWASITRGAVGTPFAIDLYETLLQPVGPTEDPATNHTGTVLQPPPAGTPVRIAPGTGGQFKITVKNFSEVDVEVRVVDGTPIVSGGFIMSDKIEWWNAGSWSSSFPGVSTGVPLAALGGQYTYTFLWRWRYDRGGGVWMSTQDKNDTELGYNGTVTYSIPLTVYVEQVD